MYGHSARNALIRVLKEAPELADLKAEPESENRPYKTWAKLKDARSRKLADRLLIELWMMGFSVSARKPDDRAPEGASRDPEKHKAWRNEKLLGLKPATKDVEEAQPAEPAKAP